MKHTDRLKTCCYAGLLVVALVASVFAAPPGSKNDSKLADQPAMVRGDEITPAQQKSVSRGLTWLATHQKPDGSFGGEEMAPRVAITALAGLAFMQAGNLPGRGKYGDNVSRCLDYVLNNCQESGLVASDATHSPMYGHGFATLFLGEIYGMTGDDRVKEKLQRAVR